LDPIRTPPLVRTVFNPTPSNMELSERSRTILDAIAKGHSYEQILAQGLARTYNDVFNAAAEALEAGRSGASGSPPDLSGNSKAYSVDDIRQAHSQAYAKWTPEEDEQLRQLSRSGSTIAEIASVLRRQPSAIHSRLTRLNLKDGFNVGSRQDGPRPSNSGATP
jgi:DNA-binding NarL/FixJ family response regulator